MKPDRFKFCVHVKKFWMLCTMLEKAKYFPGLSLIKGYREPLREVHISRNPQEKSISPGAVSVVLKYMLNNICFSCCRDVSSNSGTSKGLWFTVPNIDNARSINISNILNGFKVVQKNILKLRNSLLHQVAFSYCIVIFVGIN